MKTKQEIIDLFKICRICGSECKTNIVEGPKYLSLLPPSKDYYERYYCINNHFMVSLWIDVKYDEYYFNSLRAIIGDNYVNYQRGVNIITLCINDIMYECNYPEWEYGRSFIESEIVFFSKLDEYINKLKKISLLC